MWTCDVLATLFGRACGTAANMDMTRREYDHVLLRGRRHSRCASGQLPAFIRQGLAVVRYLHGSDVV